MKKIKFWRRALAFFLIATVVCACGKNNNENTQIKSNEDDNNYINNFSEADFPISEGKVTEADICMNSMGTYVLEEIQNSNYEITSKLFYKENGTEDYKEINLPDDAFFNMFCCDNEGNYCLGKTNLVASGNDDSDSSEYNGALVSCSSDGNELWRCNLSGKMEDGYIRDIVYAKDGSVLALLNGKIYLFEQGREEGFVLCEREIFEGDYYDGAFVQTREDEVYLCEPDKSRKYRLFKYNVESRRFGEAIDIPDGVSADRIWTGYTYDFYYSGRNELYGFNIGDSEGTKLCDYTASNVFIENIRYVGENPEGELFLCSSSYSGDDYTLYKLSKNNDESNHEKITVTIGMTYLPEGFREHVVHYNQTNDKYRVKIINFCEDEAADELGVTEVVNLAITQGNAPDILAFDYEIPWRGYISKGLLEPLDSFIDADDEIRYEDYLPNIVEASRVNGSIYYLIPSFAIETCLAAKENVDGAIDIGNYKDCCLKNGIDPLLGMGYLPKEYADEIYMACGSELIDYDNGTCSYDSDEGRKLLEWINNLPTETELDRIGMAEMETYYRQNKSLLMQYYISNFNDYQMLKKGYFGKEVVFNGFPSTDGGKSFICADTQLAITSTSNNKEAAWDFIRTFLLDDYQGSIEYYFPVSKKAMDDMALKAQEDPYYIDENGEKHEMSSYYDIGGSEVEMKALSKTETDELCDFVTSVDGVIIQDNVVANIISEEAGAYYAGEKSLEEVTRIIQSRVSLYLSENS